MKYLFTLLCIFYCKISCLATDFTGIYQYSKGINKATGQIYLFQVKSDTLFFIIQTLSGAPDYHSNSIKGFAKIDSNKADYFNNKNCHIHFDLSQSTLKVSEDTICKSEFTSNGLYKKMPQKMKKSPMMMSDFTEKPVKPPKDSLLFYSVPHKNSDSKWVHCKEGQLKIIDEFQSYFLVEHKSYKDDFLWIPKHKLFPNKK